MLRFATVRNARDAKQLWAYLPGNYNIVGGDIGEPGQPVYVIAGVDDAGWTLDGYVIPRLASGLIWAEEVDPLMVKDVRRQLEQEATRETTAAAAMQADVDEQVRALQAENRLLKSRLDGARRAAGLGPLPDDENEVRRDGPETDRGGLIGQQPY